MGYTETHSTYYNDKIKPILKLKKRDNKIIAVFAGIWVFWTVGMPFILPNESVYGIIYLAGMIGILIIANLLTESYDLNLEQKSFYYAYKALSYIDSYKKTKLEHDKKMICKYIKKLKRLINNWYSIGNLQITQQLLGKHLERLQNIGKLIPLIKKGNEKDLDTIADFLNQFLIFLSQEKPSVYSLELATNKLEPLLSKYIEVKTQKNIFTTIKSQP